VTLDGPEGHHAADVRRLRVGEALWLTDGAGARGSGVVGAVRRGALDIDVADWTNEARSVPRLAVVQALAKGGRDEDAVEAMTEVGVDEVLGWQASRSIAKWTDRTGAKWTGTAEAAARQSRRVWWPTVTGPASTADVVARIQAADVSLVMHEAAGASISTVELTGAAEVLIVVGPEGGIADHELDAFGTAGAQLVRLGESVLRSSTAGVVALAVIAARTRWT
jgi:16S rRNA (uracil1498-N3)-methyltransferase